MAYRDPPGVSVRDAEPGDGAALAELCRQVPIETPGRRMWFDYGEDYLAATALCAGREVLLAEEDGEIVGLHGGAYHAVVLDGRSFDACYIRHTRIDARAQGSGVFSSLNGRLFERIRLNCDFNYSIVAMGNDRMLDNIPAMQRSAPPHSRFSVVCRDVARSQAPGEHIPSIEEAVTLLNDAHRSETMFLPHTAASLEDRLTTVPDYTPAHLLAAGSAVVGVRDHPVHVTVEDDHGRRGAVQETAVDAGCGSDGGDDLEALVRSWCTRLADEGVEERDRRIRWLACLRGAREPRRERRLRRQPLHERSGRPERNGCVHRPSAHLSVDRALI